MIPYASNNTLVTSPFYNEILEKFNETIAKNGRVNKTKFYDEYVGPKVPGYSKDSFYKFLKRIQKTSSSLLPAAVAHQAETRLIENLRDSAEATRIGITAALNIGSDALEEILNNPQSTSVLQRVELLFKAMNAQNNRINALAALRQDRREEVKFQKTFADAAYADIDDDL